MNITEFKKLEEFEKDYWWHQGRFYLLRTLINKYLPNNKSMDLFEFGCGTGGTMSVLRTFGNVGGIDISEEAINFCKSKGFKNLICGDIETYDFRDHYGKYDGLFALDVLEHIQNDVLALRIAGKMMKPDGKLFITVPAHKFLWSEHDEANQHKRRYHSVELKHKLSEAGFKLEKYSYFVTFAFFPMFVYKMWKNIFKRSKHPESSYVRLPVLLNNFGIQILKLETKLFNIMKLPIGTTIVIVAKK